MELWRSFLFGMHSEGLLSESLWSEGCRGCFMVFTHTLRTLERSGQVDSRFMMTFWTSYGDFRFLSRSVRDGLKNWVFNILYYFKTTREIQPIHRYLLSLLYKGIQIHGCYVHGMKLFIGLLLIYYHLYYSSILNPLCWITTVCPSQVSSM